MKSRGGRGNQKGTQDKGQVKRLQSVAAQRNKRMGLPLGMGGGVSCRKSEWGTANPNDTRQKRN